MSKTSYPKPLSLSGFIWCAYGLGGLVFELYGLSNTGLYPDSVGGRGVTWGYQAATAIGNLIPVAISLLFLVIGISVVNKSTNGVLLMGIISTLLGGLTTALVFLSDIEMGSLFDNFMAGVGTLLIASGMIALANHGKLKRHRSDHDTMGSLREQTAGYQKKPVDLWKKIEDRSKKA